MHKILKGQQAMPQIYDNKQTAFLEGLNNALKRSYKADICTAYFNLRGWQKMDEPPQIVCSMGLINP